MEITLESLGLTKKDIEIKIIDAAVERILHGKVYDENGDEEVVSSGLEKKMNVLIKERIDETIGIFGEKHILPNIDKYITSLVLQEKTKWGEDKGRPFTLIEYMVDRAESYMKEKVDRYGKTEAQCNKSRDSFCADGTRVSSMIGNYLQSSIEKSMKTALENANHVIADGLSDAVKIKLKEVQEMISIGVKTER